MAESETPDPETTAALVAALMVALLSTLPKARAGRLLVALSLAFEQLEMARRRGGLGNRVAVRSARRWFASALPAIMRAVRRAQGSAP